MDLVRYEYIFIFQSLIQHVTVGSTVQYSVLIYSVVFSVTAVIQLVKLSPIGVI